MSEQSTDRQALLDRAESFRRELRDFCENDFPESVKRKVADGQLLEAEDFRAQVKALGTRGWVAGHWPSEYGGCDWSPLERFVFEEESQLRGAPWLIPQAINYVAPVIIHFGDEAQKRRFLPPILSGEHWWTQGYSEPAAGSDLAALKTRAVRVGDKYIVNGQKLWTSNAHWADWMFALVRTGDGERKQEGISFLLIDMKTPGITVRPVITIDGHHHCNEVFLDNVEVPVENLVGAEGQGWSYGKFLLGEERLVVADTGMSKRHLLRLRDLFDSGQAWRSDNEADVRDQLDELELRLHGLRMICIEAALRGHPTPSEGSMIKIRATELQQAIAELAVEVIGPGAAAYDPERAMGPEGQSPVGPAASPGITCEYLHGRAKTIFGGSNEIQRNIISKAELGL
ncbi:acyl-CoA dehydrogenase family protein [Sphingomonas sp. Root710]|uniref:acyl-CoA dehydrogenase family protein n=1 Tax=Sphingomonas sp. Root710 TaxID=1736594 RepID=UPI0009EB8C29|nr:acyl-CoA dehydrogenase family protein [Sphingomonas sp. Root710]